MEVKGSEARVVWEGRAGDCSPYPDYEATPNYPAVVGDSLATLPEPGLLALSPTEGAVL